MAREIPYDRLDVAKLRGYRDGSDFRVYRPPFVWQHLDADHRRLDPHDLLPTVDPRAFVHLVRVLDLALNQRFGEELDDLAGNPVRDERDVLRVGLPELRL